MSTIIICDTTFTYDENTKKITCPCTSTLAQKTPSYVKRHLNTKKHKKYIEQQQVVQQQVEQQQVEQQQVVQQQVVQQQVVQQQVVQQQVVQQQEQKGMYFEENCWKMIKSYFVPPLYENDNLNFHSLIDPMSNDLYINDLNDRDLKFQIFVRNTIYDKFLAHYKGRINNLERVKQKLVDDVMSLHLRQVEVYAYNDSHNRGRQSWERGHYRVYYEIEKDTGRVNILVGKSRLSKSEQNTERYDYKYVSISYPEMKYNY